MSRLQENLQLAKRAIRYVKKLGITSVNVPFRLSSYQRSPLSRFDMFLFHHMCSESHYSPATISRHALASGRDRLTVANAIHSTHMTKREILAILRSNDSNSQKKKKLKELMNRVHYDPASFVFLGFKHQTDAPDEMRIRCVRKSIKFQHGNAGEKAAIAATWLLEQTKNQKKIFWVGANNWSHCWTIMGEVGKLDAHIVENESIRNWDEATVIADGWTGDYYAAKHPFHPGKSGSFPNPFQLWVRRKVHDTQRDIAVKEDLEWPPKFSPGFTLEKAARRNREYEILSPKLKGIFDDWDSVEYELPDDLDDWQRMVAQQTGLIY